MMIEISVSIPVPVPVAWDACHGVEHIVRWDAGDAWRVTEARNDLRTGGRMDLLLTPLEGGEPTSFGATYLVVDLMRVVEWRSDEGQTVRVEFKEMDGTTVIRQAFDADPSVPVDVQRADWQAVLDRYATYVVGLSGR